MPPLAPLEGVALYGYGDSYVAAAGASTAQKALLARFAQRAKTDSNGWHNLAVAGTSMSQNVVLAASDATAKWTPGSRGIVVLKAVINSIINVTSAQDPVEQVAFQHAVTDMLRIFRSSAWVPESDASCVYTGTWAPVSLSAANGGTIQKTSTIGDKVTVTTTAGEIALVLLAFPNAAGCNFTVKVNGTQVSTGTTIAQGSPTAGGYNQITHRVSGLTGTSTIELVNNGGATNELYFDGYLVKSATPPPVIVSKDATPTVAGLQVNGADTNRTAAGLAVYNGFIDTICGSAEFADGLVFVADPSVGYNAATMENPSLRPHPSDQGHSVYADALVHAAASIGYVPGLTAS